MAETLGPRVPDAPGRLYGGDQRRLWGATGQLQRQRVATPAPVQQVTSGGGIVGMAQVDSVASSIYDDSAAHYLDYSAVTYSAPTDPNTLAPGLDPSGWLTVSGYQLQLEAGWYDITVLVDLAWPGGTMEWFRPQIIAGYDMPHQNPPIYPAVAYSGRVGISQMFNFGPTYVASPVWFELRYGDAAGAGGALEGLTSASFPWISWAIAKYA